MRLAFSKSASWTPPFLSDRMRFLLDENVHRGLTAFLVAKGHDATLSPKGLVNGRVLALAVTENRVLITHDSDFSEKMSSDRHAGIILVKIFPKHFDQLKSSILRLLSEKGSPDSFSGKLFLLFDGHFDEIPFRLTESGL